MPNDYSHDDLTAQLSKPGWQRVTGSSSQSGTLADMAKAAHADRAQHPGVVKEVETAVELSLVQLQLLWQHLGLPE